jgi:hypothetical protein
MTRAETYRQRAADYARQALNAEPQHRQMYADLAKAWRELADTAEGVTEETRSFRQDL